MSDGVVVAAAAPAQEDEETWRCGLPALKL
jgi:hypothetical protein